MRREHIARLLPDVFQRTSGADPDLLSALLGVMEDLHAPVEYTLAHIEQAFQPDDAPESFLPYLASWLDLDRFLDENGKEYFRHVGFFPEEELVKVLQQKGVK